uniref:Cation channel sperm-associated auxiliary subunit delta n=1 Tax=Callorhinchus milii TaxID=7868 RepID=A0A4W3HWZ2_CALMI
MQDLMSLVFLFPVNLPYQSSKIFYSKDNAQNFVPLYKQKDLQGIVKGVYFLPTISAIGILLRTDDELCFRYVSLVNQLLFTSAPFKLFKYANFNVVQSLHGFAGNIIIWSYYNLLFSPNNGITFYPVTVIRTLDYPYNTLPREGVFINQVLVDTGNEIAVITNKGDLFYGRLSVDAVLVKIKTVGNLRVREQMIFNKFGDLSIIESRKGYHVNSIDFFHCIIWINQELNSLEPPLPHCMVQSLESKSWKRAYYIDIKENASLFAQFVPATSQDALCLVTMSNPDLVKFQAYAFVTERTVDGDWVFSLELFVTHAYNEDVDKMFNRSLLFTGITTVVIDVLDKGIRCKDLAPLAAYIVIGCPPAKELRVVKKLTTCPKEIFNDTFSYVIKRNAYDPDRLFRPGTGTKDIYVPYDQATYGCPMAVHFESPWVPTLQLWVDGKFIEDIKVEFVIYEVNGMFNYNYDKRVSQINCLSEPQTWKSMLSKQKNPNPDTAWNAKNYHSCQDPLGPRITDGNREFQIMGGGNGNRILFQKYTGFYIFRVIVVNPTYSFCHLTATFSVYVFGAAPMSAYSSELLLALFIIFLTTMVFIGFCLFNLKTRLKKTEIIIKVQQHPSQ